MPFGAGGTQDGICTHERERGGHTRDRGGRFAKVLGTHVKIRLACCKRSLAPGLPLGDRATATGREPGPPSSVECSKLPPPRNSRPARVHTLTPRPEQRGVRPPPCARGSRGRATKGGRARWRCGQTQRQTDAHAPRPLPWRRGRGGRKGTHGAPRQAARGDGGIAGVTLARPGRGAPPLLPRRAGDPCGLSAQGPRGEGRLPRSVLGREGGGALRAR